MKSSSLKWKLILGKPENEIDEIKEKMEGASDEWEWMNEQVYWSCRVKSFEQVIKKRKCFPFVKIECKFTEIPESRKGIVVIWFAYQISSK